MLAVALILNCLIVFPLTRAMLRGSAGMDEVFGPQTDARRILACIYGAIGMVSLWALWQLWSYGLEAAWAVAWPLFLVQIIYKLGTALAVGLHSPVVLTNLFVVLVLLVTIWVG